MKWNCINDLPVNILSRLTAMWLVLGRGKTLKGVGNTFVHQVGSLA